MKTLRLSHWFVVLNLSIGLACLPLFVQGDSFSAAGSATGDFGPTHLSPLLRWVQVFSLEEGQVSSSLSLARNASLSASEGWHSYPIYGGEMTSITQDGGATWQRDYLGGFGVSDIAVNPRAPFVGRHRG